MKDKFLDFIKKSTTPYHAVAQLKAMLTEAGFAELSEGEDWVLSSGGAYFTVRNGSSLIAFRSLSRRRTTIRPLSRLRARIPARIFA